MDGMSHQHSSGQQGASSAGTAAPVAVQQQQPQTSAAQLLPPHLLGLMTNPALAAAAAASPLFPPAAMLSNPGAYLAMPEAFNVMNNLNNAAVAAAANGNVQHHNNTINNNTTTSMQAQMLQQLAGGFQAAAAAAAASSNTTTGAASNNNNNNNITPIAPLVAAFHQNPAFALPLAPPASAAANNNNNITSGYLSCSNSNSDNKTLTAAQQQQRRADANLTPEEKARQNRDRNREHARSTRLRKKAYVQKLKELVEGLHAERTEEVRQRRVAIQHLAEMQNIRRTVVSTFLRFHSNYETDARKWSTILEEDFWLKQPVTPYRSFRRAEIEQECRIVRGIEAMICDSASLAVMIESIGSRSPRWMQIKREEFLLLEEQQRGSKKMPRCILRQDSRLQHAVSSLSSSSGSSNHHHHHVFSSSGEDSGNKKQQQRGGGGHHHVSASSHTATLGLLKSCSNNDSKANTISAGQAAAAVLGGQKASLSSHCNISRNNNQQQQQQQQQQDGLHDYHAKPLPDPKLRDSEGSSEMAEDSPEDSNASSAGDTKRVSTDSSSGDDSAGPRATKKRKVGNATVVGTTTGGSEHGSGAGGASCSLPPNVAKKGGIPHSIQPVTGNGTARLSMAPAVALPPFSGIGKRSGGSASSSHGMSSSSSTRKETRTETVLDQHENTTSSNLHHHHHHHAGGPAVIAADADCSSISSGSKVPQIRGYYHINEDDMILMEDVMMCPFIFRSQDAVLCGALAECVMPGMLRAAFSSRNKLQSLELVYDAMGFMQQLERASGNEGTAQIIPGSLEMALSPSTTEALVITMAEPPFLIVNVNEVWTRTTGYTQMQVEGKEYMSLLEGEGTVSAASNRPGKPRHSLEYVANGRCSCSTNIHYDKDGRDFIEFVCSYPLTNANDEVTHLLHVSKELPSFPDSTMIGTGSR